MPIQLRSPAALRIYRGRAFSHQKPAMSWEGLGISAAAAAVLDAMLPEDREKMRLALDPAASFSEEQEEQPEQEPSGKSSNANVYQTIALQKAYTAGEIERGAAIETAVSVGQIPRDTAEKLFPLKKPTVLTPGTAPATAPLSSQPTLSEQPPSQQPPTSGDTLMDSKALSDKIDLWDKIGTALKFSQDTVGVLMTLPPDEMDIVQQALEFWISKGGPATFSEKKPPRRMSWEGFGISPAGAAVLDSMLPGDMAKMRRTLDPAARPAAFSQKKPGSCMTPSRRREFLAMAGPVGEAILRDERKANAAAFSSAKRGTGTAAALTGSCMTPQRRQELLGYSGAGESIIRKERALGVS